MRLATVYASEASMRASIAGREPSLRAAMDRLRSRTEWGVKGYVVPGTAAPPPEIGGSGGAGAAYLRRRRDELASQKDARRETLASAEIIHAELSRYAADARLHPPQAPQLTGSKELMILNAAYLVDDGQADDFAAMVEALAEQYPSVRLELTGPWPPYSFAGNPERED